MSNCHSNVICHNKHHLLYIEWMNPQTLFEGSCHALPLFGGEKSNSHAISYIIPSNLFRLMNDLHYEYLERIVKGTKGLSLLNYLLRCF